MGGGKKGGSIQIAEYYMSLHFGVCATGRNIELLEVKIGEKIAWEGNLRQNDVQAIRKPELFGGQKKEGGAIGLLWWLNGNESQRLPAALSDRLGLESSRCPGFRGLASFFLTGTKIPKVDGLEVFWPNLRNALASLGIGSSGPVSAWILQAVGLTMNTRGGFLLGANNPYLKTVSARCRRAPEGLTPALAMIRIPDSSEGKAQYAANGAHIVFECMTNRDWGMGESYGAFNIASFEECAQTLYDEGFGLNLLWSQQSTIEDFIKDVLDHVQGAVFVDPATGKHTMKLLRGDYDPDDLPLITPDNAKVTNFQRRVWGEISNEVVVTWTNPETGNEETVVAQDLGAISAQGGISSTSRNYHGIPYQDLAMRVAERDLAAVVHPVITLDAEVTREFWKTVTYGVIALTWPKHGIDRSVFRISKVTNGSTSRTIRLSLYEDVFGLDKASYLGSASSGWINPSAPPAPIQVARIRTAPAFMVASVMGLEDPGDIQYPQTISLLVVAPNSGDDIGYELVADGTNVVGNPVQQNLGERALNASWLLTSAMVQEARTTITAPPLVGPAPEAGDFLMFDGIGESSDEIGVIREINGNDWVIDRGLLDTTPRAWPAGARVFVIPYASIAPDETVRSAYEEVRYRLLTKTPRGVLEIEDAPPRDGTLTDRADLPLRPTNVRVEGTFFGTAQVAASAATIDIRWRNRNRTDESTQVLLWTDATVAPESGQTTRITVMRPNRTVITTISDLPGIVYNMPIEDLNGETDVIIRVTSVRGGKESLQGHEVRLVVT